MLKTYLGWSDVHKAFGIYDFAKLSVPQSSVFAVVPTVQFFVLTAVLEEIPNGVARGSDFFLLGVTYTGLTTFTTLRRSQWKRLLAIVVSIVEYYRENYRGVFVQLSPNLIWVLDQTSKLC